MNQSTRNVILFLAVCTVFVSTADCDTCTYSSTCYKQERYTVKCGLFGWKRCTRYRSVAYSCTLTSSCSYTLLSCGSCSNSCDGGTMTCTYYCSGSLCSLPNKESSQSCNTHHCPIHGRWSVWTDWNYSNCDVTCGGGTQIRNRIRSCNNPWPQYGGKECIGNSKESETVSCNSNKCPIHGNWTAWSNWVYGTCSVTCDGGIQGQNRSRNCTNPIPQFGGKQCVGNATESQAASCNTNKCPKDGGWSDWGDWQWSNCSRPCNGGKRIRYKTRSCTNPAPSNGGQHCIGQTYKYVEMECNIHSCPKKSRETLNLKRLMDDIFSDELPCTNGTVRVNTKNCENFQVCINGTWQELACNKGTLYDSDIEACNWPKNVPGCTNTSNVTTRATETRGGDGSGCKSVDCVCQDSIDGIIGHPTYCTKFIICIGSKPYVESCDDGTYWEQSMLSCQSGTC